MDDPEMKLKDQVMYNGRAAVIVGVVRVETADRCGWYNIQFHDTGAWFLAASHELQPVVYKRETLVTTFIFLFLLSQVLLCVILSVWSGWALDPFWTVAGAGLVGHWSGQLARMAGFR